MQFFQYRATAGESRSVVAHDAERQRFYRYVGATGLWHHATDLGPVLDRLDPLQGRSALAAALRESPRLDERIEAHKARAIAYRGQITELGETFTSAELGVTMAELGRGHRPIATPGLPALLSARGQHWTVLSRYGRDSARTASYTAVETAQRSTRFSRPVQAQRCTDLLADQHLVIVRLTPQILEEHDADATAGDLQAETSSREVGTVPAWT